MRKIPLITYYLVLSTTLLGCAKLKRITQPLIQVITPGVDVLAPYSGPKAKIAIADFEVKAPKTSQEIGPGLRQMLVTALINSNRFSVAEPAALTSDLIITAAVMEFEPPASGGRSGVGGGGGAGSGAFGGLLGTVSNRARMALDIRIIDSSTSKVLAATRARGQAADIKGANRICIIEALRYIAQGIPANYYKH